MNKNTEQKLREEINVLIVKRLSFQKGKGAETIISIIKEIIEILNEEYPHEDVQGFVFEWNRETEEFRLRTYPDEVFPNSFNKDEKLNLRNRMDCTTCTTGELSKICQFFSCSAHTNLILMGKKNGKEEYQIKFV